MQPGQMREQCTNKVITQAYGRPLLEHTKIQYVPDDGKPGEHVRTDEYIGAFDFHGVRLLLFFLFGVGFARLDIKSPTGYEDVQLHPYEADRITTARLVHRRIA